MQTQTPRRAEDYLLDLQATVRASSPVSHVLQEGCANIQQVLRERYTLTAGSLPSSSDRDLGYATSSNSDMYAPVRLCREAAGGREECEDDEECEEPEPLYQLSLDTAARDGVPVPQEARTRHRLSQFSMPDLSSPASPATDTPGSDRATSEGLTPRSRSRSGSERNVHHYYASVTLTGDGPGPSCREDSTSLSRQYAPPPVPRSSEAGRVRFFGDVVPLYCQARPVNARSVPELPNVGVHARGQGLGANQASAARESRANLGPYPNGRHVQVTTPGEGGGGGCPRSQSFEGGAGTLAAPHQHRAGRGTAGAEGQFPYGRYNHHDDGGCSTCSSSSDSDDWGYSWYGWPRPADCKLSYVDDMGIGGVAAPGQARARRHKKHKQCVLS